MDARKPLVLLLYRETHTRYESEWMDRPLGAMRITATESRTEYRVVVLPTPVSREATRVRECGAGPVAVGRFGLCGPEADRTPADCSLGNIAWPIRLPVEANDGRIARPMACFVTWNDIRGGRRPWRVGLDAGSARTWLAELEIPLGTTRPVTMGQGFYIPPERSAGEA